MSTKQQEDVETMRQELREIVEELPVEDLLGVRSYLRYLMATKDPLVKSLLEAPLDDEPLTPEDEAAIEEGLRALEKGDVVSDEEMKRRLGL